MKRKNRKFNIDASNPIEKYFLSVESSSARSQFSKSDLTKIKQILSYLMIVMLCREYSFTHSIEANKTATNKIITHAFMS